MPTPILLTVKLFSQKHHAFPEGEVDPIFWTGSLGVIFTRFLPVGSILGDAPL